MALKIVLTDNDELKDEIDNIIMKNREELKEALLLNIMNKDPYFFEMLVSNLLEKMGYGKGQVTKKSGDGGIDAIMLMDRFGFMSIGVQAKRYGSTKKVGRPEVQQLMGALTKLKTLNGILITTSSFTKEATDCIEYSTNFKIKLIDGNELLDLLIEYEIGVTKEATYTLKTIDHTFFK